MVDLQPEPGFRRNTETGSQPQSRIGRDGAKAIHDCANAIGRDDKVGEPVG
jgi:hypothetical protein